MLAAATEQSTLQSTQRGHSVADCASALNPSTSSLSLNPSTLFRGASATCFGRGIKGSFLAQGAAAAGATARGSAAERGSAPGGDHVAIDDVSLSQDRLLLLLNDRSFGDDDAGLALVHELEAALRLQSMYSD